MAIRSRENRGDLTLRFWHVYALSVKDKRCENGKLIHSIFYEILMIFMRTVNLNFRLNTVFIKKYVHSKKLSEIQFNTLVKTGFVLSY